ncbi:MAG: hypothetical protein AAB569_00900 [Patescibacteria group bacterium]
MNITFTVNAVKDLEELPVALRKTTFKQLELLRRDIRHPSIHAKKYDENNGVWQGRVNLGYRFYFRIVGSVYRILRVIPHPK